MNNKTKQNKKAQEEVMGFVIIVMIVMIIGLVFFAFSLRKSSQTSAEPKQAELDDFLNTVLSYTTDCEISANNQSIRELARQCSKEKRCQNGIEACDSLNETLSTILPELLGENAQIANAYVHGYSFNISNSEQLINITQGNLTGDCFASSVPIPTGTEEDIWVRLRYYYSK